MWSLTGPSGNILSKMLIQIQTFPFKRMHLKLSSAKCLPFYPDFHLLVLWRKRGFNSNTGYGSNGWQTRPITATVQIIGIQGLISECNLNGNYACSLLNYIKVPAIKFCTCYGECIVVICANILQRFDQWGWNYTQTNFHRIWITFGISLVKWIPGPKLYLFKHTHR